MRKLPKPPNTQVIDSLQPSLLVIPLPLPLRPNSSPGLEGVAPDPLQGRGAGKAALSLSVPIPFPVGGGSGVFLPPHPQQSLTAFFFLFGFCVLGWRAEGPKREERSINHPAAEQEKKGAELRCRGWQPSSPAPGL